MSARQGYALGVDLGTTYTCAAVADRSGPARVAQLSGTSQTIPSVVSVSDGSVLAGEAAERRLVSHPADTAREFKRRFGDPAPIVLGGETFGADVLSGHLLAEVIERVQRNEGGGPATVALAHPAAWGPFRLDLLRDAATHAGVDDVVLVPEPVAAAVANSDRVERGSLVAVYDLGGGTFDAAVVRCDDDWSVVGTPEGVERLGGIDFDQAILAHVDAALDGQVYALDTSDPDARSALMQLRAECQAAKEHLSQDTDVDIPVSLPNLRTSVRLTRSEFEGMVQPRLADSLAVFDRVVASAGASWDDISAVLLVGGSSNIPVVRQLVAEHPGRPVVTATNPHMAIAVGTAAVAAERLAATAPVSGTVPAAVPPGTSAPPPPPGPSEPVAPTSGSSRRSWALIGGGIGVAILAIAGIVLFTGGDDAAAPVDSGTATTVAEPAASDPVDTEPAISEPATSDPVETDPPTTEPAPPPLSASITLCGPGDPSVVATLELGGEPVSVGDDGVASLPGATVDPCVVDLGARTPDASLAIPASPTSAASFGQVMAVAAADGGAVLNRATANVVDCPFLTGPLAVNQAGVAFTIVGGTVERIRTEGDSCSQQDNSSLVGIAATAVGVASDDQIALGGDVDGSIEVWVFDGQENRVVLGGSGAAVPDGFGSVDALVRCDDAWCVVDLSRGVLHVVALDGTYTGAAPLAGTQLDGAARVVSSGTSAAGPAIVTAEAGDGSRSIIRLSLG